MSKIGITSQPMSKAYLLSIFFLGILSNAWGQKTAFSGKVMDGITKQPLEYATVTLLGSDSSIISGALTNTAGDFKIMADKPVSPTLKVQSIGYQSIMIKASKDGSIDVAEIYLHPNEYSLDEVTVEGEKRTTSITLEKQVFSVNQFQNAANGTGLDLIQRLPSVTVNTEGTLLFRGSESFMILLNGKPTTRTAADILAQLPANTIQSIEVITTPQAKYDAEGKSGIINIVLKEAAYQGWNWQLNTMFGGIDPLRWGTDATLSYSSKKWNFFISADYRRFDIEGFRIGVIRTIFRDTLTYLPSEGIRNYRDEQHGLRTGWTFTPNSQNTFSLGYYRGEKQTDRTANLHYKEFLGFSPIADLYEMNVGKPVREFFNQNLFIRSGEFQTASADWVHSFGNKSRLSILGIWEYSVLGGPLNNLDEWEGTDIVLLHERSTENSPLHAGRAQIDYSLPLPKGSKLEMGYQWRTVNHKGTFAFERLNIGKNVWEKDPEFNDELDLTQDIHGAYVSLSGGVNKLAYNLGLRAEYMDRILTHNLGTKDFTLTQLDLFPTAQAIWALNQNQKFRLGYSRRINRPTTKLMSPFKNHRHAETIELGDPNLRPEIADVVEASYNKTWQTASISATAYFNYTADKIFRVNDIYTRTILWRTYTNAGNATSTGMELSGEIRPLSWLKFYASGNIFNFQVKGAPNNPDARQSSLNFNANGNTTIDITKRLRFQWDLNYVSRTVTAQGEDSDLLLSNLSLRQTFAKERFFATLQLQNIFDTNNQTIAVTMNNFYSSTDYIKYDRILSLSLGYRFNQQTRKGKNLGTEYGEKDF